MLHQHVEILPKSMERQAPHIPLTGTGFEPGNEVEIWWRDPIGNEFRQRQEGNMSSYILMKMEISR